MQSPPAASVTKIKVPKATTRMTNAEKKKIRKMMLLGVFTRNIFHKHCI